MEWVFLGMAGVLEMGWAVGLKYSQGFTRLIPSAFTVFGMVASFYCLSLALRSLPLGTAYAIWTGIGTVVTVVLGIVLFQESIDTRRLVCVAFIIIGIVGLKMLSPH